LWHIAEAALSCFRYVPIMLKNSFIGRVENILEYFDFPDTGGDQSNLTMIKLV
jgi:hypothetical protein